MKHFRSLIAFVLQTARQTSRTVRRERQAKRDEQERQDRQMMTMTMMMFGREPSSLSRLDAPPAAARPASQLVASPESAPLAGLGAPQASTQSNAMRHADQYNVSLILEISAESYTRQG